MFIVALLTVKYISHHNPYCELNAKKKSYECGILCSLTKRGHLVIFSNTYGIDRDFPCEIILIQMEKVPHIITFLCNINCWESEKKNKMVIANGLGTGDTRVM